MKKICILGCSHSTGAELHDEHLFDDYWDFLQEKERSSHIKEYLIHIQKIEKMYGNNLYEYMKDCKQWSWIIHFEKLFKNNVDIQDFSLEGTGIDFFQYLYNFDEIKKQNEIKYIPEFIKYRTDLKKQILDSDLLIWQLTEEPRLFITSKGSGFFLLSTTLANLSRMVKNKWNRDFSKRDIKLLLDYYENVFDEEKHFHKITNFIDYIISERTLRKKKTIFFSVFRTNLLKINYRPKNSEYVHWCGLEPDDSGIVNELVAKQKITIDESSLKFGHPSKKCQQLMAEYVFNYINNFGLI
jgi:hypothetical protein